MAKNKDMNISIKPENVVFTAISKEKNGYNSARMVIKAGDKEYMHVSYEWEGTGVPDFAMNLMDFMKANNVETSGIWPGQEEAHEEIEAAKKMTPEEFKMMIEEKKKKKDKKKASVEDVDAAAKKKEKMCPDCKKPMSECECEDDEMEDE